MNILWARRLVAEAGNRGLKLLTPEKFNAKAGLGVQAVVDGEEILIGNQRLLGDLSIDSASAKAYLEEN